MSSISSPIQPINSSSVRFPLSPWDLPSLLTPLHAYKPVKVKQPKERDHYLAVTGFLYRNRYAIATQIQRRFAHVIKSDRTARRHLAELQALGWLDVTPTRGTSPLFPKVFHVTGRGARKLREALAAKGKAGHVIRVDRSRREGFSADHVLHEVLITEFMLMVWEAAYADDRYELLRVERRSIPSHPAFKLALRSKMSRLEPDAMFLYREEGQGMMCCFVEIDTGSMTKQQLKAKFFRYETWAQSRVGQDFQIDLYRRHGASEPRPVFRILAVAADWMTQSHRTQQRGSVTAGLLATTRTRVRELRAAAATFPTISRRLWVASSSDVMATTFSIFDRSVWS